MSTIMALGGGIEVGGHRAVEPHGAGRSASPPGKGVTVASSALYCKPAPRQERTRWVGGVTRVHECASEVSGGEALVTAVANTSPERAPSRSACSFCADELTHTHAQSRRAARKTPFKGEKEGVRKRDTSRGDKGNKKSRDKRRGRR